MSDLHPVFVRAKEILLTQGWYCGGPRGPYKSRCLILACVDAYNEIYKENVSDGDLGRIHRVLREIINVPFNRLAAWNDNPERTFEEVIAVLDQAIILTAPVVELVGSC